MIEKEKIYLFFLISITFITIINILHRSRKKGRGLNAEKYESQNKNVLFINTGGNMGLVRTKNGYVHKNGFLRSQLHQMTKGHSEIPNYDIIEFKTLIDSNDISPQNWSKIASQIGREYQNYDAFVIIHPVESIGYTASALAFILENIKKPIIFTGSMISIHEKHPDARENLFFSLQTATKHSIPEVIVCYNNQILRGCRTSFSDNRIISAQFAPLGFKNKNKLIEINEKIILKPNKEYFKLAPINPAVNIILVKVFPGINAKYLEGTLKSHKKIHGIILETYGNSKIPVDKSFLEMLKNIMKDKTFIVQTSSYSSHIDLMDVGIINGLDLTVEAAFTKLSFLLSNISDSRDEIIHQLMMTNMRGEISSTY